MRLSFINWILKIFECKKHAKLQKFMQIAFIILSLHPQNFEDSSGIISF